MKPNGYASRFVSIFGNHLRISWLNDKPLCVLTLPYENGGGRKISRACSPAADKANGESFTARVLASGVKKPGLLVACFARLRGGLTGPQVRFSTAREPSSTLTLRQ